MMNSENPPNQLLHATAYLFAPGPRPRGPLAQLAATNESLAIKSRRSFLSAAPITSYQVPVDLHQ